MGRESIFLNTATYQAGMQKALLRIMDFFSLIAAIGCALAFVRINQFGGAYFVALMALIALCVLPALFLRKDKHLTVRGLLTITGLLIATGVGIHNAGLLSTATITLPLYLAVCATMFNRTTTYIVFVGVILVLLTAAFHFTTGSVPTRNINVSDWNRDPRNWLVAISVIFLVGFFIVMLVFSLSTSWKETEAESGSRNEQFEAMVQYAPDAIMILDLDKLHTVAINARAEELFGLSKDDFGADLQIGSNSPEKQPSGESSSELGGKYLEEALSGGHPVFEWTILGADQQEIPCEATMSRIPPFDKKLVRVSITDITKRLEEQKHGEELQAQLAVSQRRETIGQLTGGVAHDFNNLLAIILGNLEFLQEETDDEKRKELLQTCIAATLRGADLTRSMLAFARRAPLQPQTVDLNKLVRETKNWSGRTLPTNIDVDTSFLAGLWEVEVDASSAESALLNLILNARDAMPTGGKLTIETSNIRIDQTYVDARNEELEQGRYVMVAVSDTGAGIEAEKLDRIFEPFYTTKEAGKGSGLGLAMVLGFMRQSGGTAQVYSEPGVGTTFKLYFPAKANRQKDLEHKQPEDNVSQVRGKRVLLAEDEDEVRIVLKAMLEGAGMLVTDAETGDAAKAVFETEPRFDLLLTDIVMPGHLQGTTLAQELRALDESLPVIFMSGYATEATVHGNGLRPEDIRLMKPVTRKELLAAVVQAIKT